MFNLDPKHWPRSEAAMKWLIGTIVNNPDFIVVLAVLEKQGATNAIEETLNAKSKVTEDIPSSTDRSTLASSGLNSDDESEAFRSLRKRFDQKDRRHLRFWLKM